MKKYEIMFIVKSTMESDDIKKTADNFQKIITDYKSKVVEFKELGEKKLAYPISKEINGYYYVMTVEASVDAINEFDRKATLEEKGGNLLRHLIIKLDEE
ncbi:MAG: 30S ribosomal protein S6 [Firmicutes bacterium]|nr:30S ribosomal protein S6 [Bacillota bacterium]